MSRALTLALATSILLASIGCKSSPAGPNEVKIGDVVFRSTKESIQTQNNTNKPVYTFIVGRNAAAYTDWFPCVEDAQCPPIQPNSSRTTTFDQANINASEVEALVYWWHAVTENGQRKPDQIRQGLLRLR